MKDRLIDIALPVALGVISVIIVLTLFSLQPPTPQDNMAQSSPAITPPAATERTVVPVRPAETPSQPEANAVRPERTTPETPSGTTTETPPEITETPPPPRPLPEGQVPLNRVGFSFAGVVGACSVELEPWRHVAVSRDLLAEYPCGSTVRVILPEAVGGRESAELVVGDTMNPVHERTVNIYVSQDEPAFQYGILEGGTFEGR